LKKKIIEEKEIEETSIEKTYTQFRPKKLIVGSFGSFQEKRLYSIPEDLELSKAIELSKEDAIDLI